MNVHQIAFTAAGLGLAAWAVRVGRRMSLREKVVFISGGSRGLGLALARQCAALGADVALCARRHEEVQRAVAELQAKGVRVLGLMADLTDPEQAGEVVRRVCRHFGRLDIVINNAGTIQVGPMETMTLEDYRSAMSSNFWTAVHVVDAALPFLKQAGGRIVNIASISGKVALPHLLPYCASKFALAGYSRGLRLELAKDGIVVTTVCPGLMRTGSHGNALFKGNTRAEYTWFSIGGSMPVVTISAECAARRIVSALWHGDAEVMLSAPAKIAAILDELCPGAVSTILELVAAALPRSTDIVSGPILGFRSHSRWAPSRFTQANEAAATANNENEPSAAEPQFSH